MRFFMLKMHQNPFRPTGGPRWGAYGAPQISYSLGRVTPSAFMSSFHFSTASTLGLRASLQT